METDVQYRVYLATRERCYARLDQIRRETDEWISGAAQQKPSLSEIARVALVFEERASLTADLQSAEEAFLEHLMQLSAKGAATNGGTQT